jgi:hypothetical protein
VCGGCIEQSCRTRRDNRHRGKGGEVVGFGAYTWFKNRLVRDCRRCVFQGQFD